MFGKDKFVANHDRAVSITTAKQQEHSVGNKKAIINGSKKVCE